MKHEDENFYPNDDAFQENTREFFCTTDQYRPSSGASPIYLNLEANSTLSYERQQHQTMFARSEIHDYNDVNSDSNCDEDEYDGPFPSKEYSFIEEIMAMDTEDFDDYLNEEDYGYSYCEDDNDSHCDEDEDSSSEIPCSCFTPTPPISLDVSLPQNKKAQSIHDIVKASFLQLNIMVIGTQFFMKYQMEEGFYKEQSTVLPDVMEALGENREQLSSSDLKNLEHILLHYPEVQLEIDQFNSESLFVNTRAGILNWQTKEVFPHSPESFFTYSIDAEFLADPLEELETPVFEQFCETSLEGDPVKKQFLLEIIGYCLSDCTGAKCAFFFNGAPDSGKSVMLDFIGKLLSETVISSVPLHELHDKFKRAELMGKKLNISGEIAGKSVKDISIYKSMTGNDRISAEHKGKSPFTYRCRAKIILAGNTLPPIKDTDVTKAFSNRMAVLLFHHSIPKEEQDKNLLDNLLVERDAIFTKAIHALSNLEKRNFVFQLPEESIVFRNKFLGMSESVDQFVEECCDLGKDNKVHKDALYEAYLKFCHEMEFTAESKNILIAHFLKFESIEEKRLRHNGENKQGLLGITLKPQN